MFLQIAPPVLHLNLGIFQKMFELMVSHYHKIDVLLLRMKTFDEPDVTDITLFASRHAVKYYDVWLRPILLLSVSKYSCTSTNIIKLLLTYCLYISSHYIAYSLYFIDSLAKRSLCVGLSVCLSVCYQQYSKNKLWTDIYNETMEVKSRHHVTQRPYDYTTDGDNFCSMLRVHNCATMVKHLMFKAGFMNVMYTLWG